MPPATITAPPPNTEVLDQPSATETVTIPTLPSDVERQEAILILQPGPGSHVTNPIHIVGVADPTFEQHLAIRLVLDDGTILTTVPTIINAEMGQRGQFEVDVPLTVSEERQGFIQIYDTSARDGGIIHLAAVGVMFTPNGPENIFVMQPQPERITIYKPISGATVMGGVAHVEGFALASFEQGLLVQLLDIEGNLLGQQSVIVTAPDVGQHGPFTADVVYDTSFAGAGRIVVRDLSPAFGGDVHVASVEVTINP